MQTTLSPVSQNMTPNMTERPFSNLTQSTPPSYDAVGALQFTIAVVFVYSLAAIGIFVMGYYGRRSAEKDETEKEIRLFLKSLNTHNV
ncbi:hypothetical protein FSP39_020661 [Pinctada imbricata]|uniref:Uncharacterized protein n=1 Tax=Pinctada imbricata TaxID=66713 RepID=A0AA88Y8R2_PINIB|nr:hypothetical protein FSP39_020661 [Pinctada imbricata]